MQITTKQIQQINAILSKLNLQEMKKELVSSVSDGRAESTKELTAEEAIKMIERLNGSQPKQAHHPVNTPASRKRRAIMHICYMMGIINNDMSNSVKLSKIDEYVTNHSHIANKKHFDDYDEKELHKLYFQFDKIYKHYLNNI